MVSPPCRGCLKSCEEFGSVKGAARPEMRLTVTGNGKYVNITRKITGIHGEVYTLKRQEEILNAR